MGQFQKKNFNYGINLTTSTTNFRGQVLGEPMKSDGLKMGIYKNNIWGHISCYGQVYILKIIELNLYRVIINE